MTNPIHEALREVFSDEELAQLRRDVQYGRCSFVTIVEPRDEREPEVIER